MESCEKATKSFDFRWRSERYEDGTNGSARLRAEALKDPDAKVPDTTYIVKYRFLMDDRGRIHLEHDGKQWSRDKSDYVPTESVSIFDGSTNQAMYKGGLAGFPIASIGGNPAESIGKLVWLDPLTMTFRPLTCAVAQFDEKLLALSLHSPDPESNQLVALHDGQWEISVDPTKDYVPVRLTASRLGAGINCRVSISHRHDPIDGWMPQSWTIEELGPDGRPYLSESTTVLKHSINRPISDSEFELDLSGGVYVGDHGDYYILRPDGTKRPILKGQFTGHNFEELMNTEPDGKPYTTPSQPK